MTSSMATAYTLPFGKHKDRTLEWLFFNDPGYVAWALREGVHRRLAPPAQQRLGRLIVRADSLAIPTPCRECGLRPVRCMVLIAAGTTTGGLAKVSFSCGQCRPPDSTNYSFARPTLLVTDLSNAYDKMGAEILIRAVKRAYWGDPGYRMTQGRLEAFFDNPDNFLRF